MSEQEKKGPGEGKVEGAGGGELPVVEYAQPVGENRGRLMMGIFGGTFGYLGLVVVVVFVGALGLPSSVAPWVMWGLVLVVPLGIMVGVARGLKSRSMMVSVLITFGVMALSCGTCVALFSH